MPAVGFAAKVAKFVFVVNSMLSLGLGSSLFEILEPLRSTRLILSALAANFVLVPMLVSHRRSGHQVWNTRSTLILRTVLSARTSAVSAFSREMPSIAV